MKDSKETFNDMIAHNLKAFEKRKAVHMFSEDTLQKPEQVIFDILNFKSMRVLDLGVGTGRTTPYLAPRSGSYVGVDYSEAMIAECRKKFPSIEFLVCDARNLPFNEPFDCIFFSFNGIDNMPHSDRLATLHGIEKLLKPGGYFAFSTHNIFGAKKLFHVQWNRNLRRTCMSLRRWYKTRSINPSWKIVSAQNHVIINEGAHALNLRQYYIKPMAQKEQLQSIGFTDIRVFDLQGREFSEPYFTEDNWMYYLCRKP